MNTDDRRPATDDGSLAGRSGASDVNQRQHGEPPPPNLGAEWENIFDSLSDAVTIHDDQFNIVAANRSARRMLGLPLSGNLPNTKCFRGYHGTEKPPAGCPSCRCAETLEETVSELFEPHLNRHLEIRALPRLDAHRRYVGVVHVVRDITNRRRAEEALRSSEEHFHLVVNATNDCMWDVDLRDGTVRFNKAYATAFGTPSPHEEPWQWWTEHVHPDDRGRTLSSFDAAVNGSADVWNCEYRFRRIDGTWAYARDRAQIRRDSTGKAHYVIGALTDITERMRAEEALRESEKLYRSLFANMAEGYAYCQMIFETGKPLDFVYLAVNPAFEALTGLRNVVGRHVSDVIPGIQESDPEIFAIYARVSVSGRSEKFEMFVEAMKMWFSISVYGADKDCFVAVFDVITERKLAEDALRKSEGRYRALIEQASDGIFMANWDGQFVEVNPAGCELLGRTASEILQLTIADVVAPSPDSRLRFSEISKGGTVVGEREAIRKDGTRVAVEISARQLPDGGVQGIVRDITERKRAMAEHAKLEAQLQQAQRMESVGRLAGGVAHDFNNMLGVIIGHTEIALDGIDAGHPLHEDLVEIRTAAGRSADLTRQLLAFARKQTVAPRVLELNETVASAIKMLERLIGEEIRLVWQPGAGLWPVRTDPSQIDQILANLCVNARDAIAGLGTIVIRTSNVTLGADFSGPPGAGPGEYVRLEVSDDGCGMDEETLAHIFEPFFTTKGVGEGTGLGLASVYGAVKQNNGYIEAFSKPDLGATIMIYIPRAVDLIKRTEPERVPRLGMRGHETILLVEDEPGILKLTMTALQRQGYTVLTARTPGDAVRVAREHAREIDLLVTDVVMPEMNGRVLAKLVLAVRPDVKCLFMSGYTADVVANHGVLDEGVSFLQKPFTLADLATRVRETLDRE